jgi:hypothetical protein
MMIHSPLGQVRELAFILYRYVTRDLHQHVIPTKLLAAQVHRIPSNNLLEPKAHIQLFNRALSHLL